MQLKNKTLVALYILVGCFFCLGFWLRLECLDVVRLNIWLTRDIDRTFNLFDGTYFPLVGPETTNGFRLPGPFLYILMAIPLWFHYSYEAIFNFYFILNCSSLFLSFFVIKKYFDFNTAFIVTVLQSTHLLFLEAIAFPINPAFLLPIIPVLVYFILEFSLKGNEKALPLIAVIISLGIQVHLSLATYILIPIISSILFKTKISLRILVKTILLTILCFLPFIYHLKNSYDPQLLSQSKFSQWNFLETPIDSFVSMERIISFIKIIKILAVQNTVNRLTDFSSIGNMSNFMGVSSLFSQIQFNLLNISLLGLGLLIFCKLRKEAIHNSKKEIIVFLLFYCSAFIYELINPVIMHFWYNYIFILPTSLLFSRVFITALRVIKPNSIKLSIKIIGFFFLAYLTFFNINYFYKTKNAIKDTVYIGDYKSFKGFSLFSYSLSKTLEIPIEYFFKNVHVQNMDLISQKLPELLTTNQPLNSKVLSKDKNINCFYIVDFRYLRGNYNDTFKKERVILDSFLKDPTIEIYSTRDIILKETNLPKFILLRPLNRKYRVYEYRPVFDQPCYISQVNPFQSSLYDKTLLDDFFNYQKNGNKLLEKRAKLGPSGELKNLKFKYIIFGDEATHPVRLIINLRKSLSGSELKIKVDSYSWGIQESDEFIFKELDLYALNDKKLLNKFEIISKDSWFSNGYSISESKFSWYRNFKLKNDIKLVDNKITFKLIGKLKYIHREKWEEKDLNAFIQIALKE